MKYLFCKDGKIVAKLEMPDDMECFEVIGIIMSMHGAQYVELEKGE